MGLGAPAVLFGKLPKMKLFGSIFQIGLRMRIMILEMLLFGGGERWYTIAEHTYWMIAL